MTFIAQTNLQLYKQLSEEGFGPEDLEYIHQAYHLALRLFSCSYRPNGKEHLAHGIGTASIVCSLQQRIPLIAASLLHAAYTQGEFPSRRKGLTESNRKYIRNALGQETEEYLARCFFIRRPKLPTPREFQERFTDLSPIDRDILLILLAEDLEKCFDLGVLYCPDASGRQRGIRNNGPIRVELARKLGYPALADRLMAAHNAVLHSEITPILRNGNEERRDFFVVPLSYRHRVRAWLSQWFLASNSS